MATTMVNGAPNNDGNGSSATIPNSGRQQPKSAFSNNNNNNNNNTNKTADGNRKQGANADAAR